MFKIILGFLLLTVTTSVYSFPDKPENYLLDSAKVLTDAQKDSLVQILEGSGKSDIYVVMYKSSDGKNPDVYAKEIGEEWGIGNGALLVIFTEDKRSGIYVGPDLLSTIDTSDVADIRQTKIDRYLKKKLYSKAAMKGARALIKASIGRYAQSRPAVIEQNQNDALNLFSGIAAVFFAITFFVYVRKQTKNIENGYEEDESAGNIPHKKLRVVYIVYGLYFLLVLNAYFGDLFGDWKKLIPLFAGFPLFGFFVLNLISVAVGGFLSKKAQ